MADSYAFFGMKGYFIFVIQADSLEEAISKTSKLKMVDQEWLRIRVFAPDGERIREIDRTTIDELIVRRINKRHGMV